MEKILVEPLKKGTDRRKGFSWSYNELLKTPYSIDIIQFGKIVQTEKTVILFQGFVHAEIILFKRQIMLKWYKM